MILALDPMSEMPIYLQIRNQIVIGIAKGELEAGERLPTVRQLAADTGVNTMTVNKAYQMLKQEGYIETDGRRGAKVCETHPIDPAFREEVKEKLELLSAESVLHGMKKEEFLSICEEMYKKMLVEE
ncbi:MAG: GntR family transcriptional regulator [Lachnospiraceae bacterium]